MLLAVLVEFMDVLLFLLFSLKPPNINRSKALVPIERPI